MRKGQTIVIGPTPPGISKFQHSMLNYAKSLEWAKDSYSLARKAACLSILSGSLDGYLATAAEMLKATGMLSAAEVLRVSSVKSEKTGFDNWNGGTTIWTIYLLVEPSMYAKLGTEREAIEQQINDCLKPILVQFTNDWCTVTIVPKVEPRSEWRSKPALISKRTRQNIIDGLKIENVHWAGRLEDAGFLQRIFDLEALPSHDGRFENAAGDIWQHRVNNPMDWPDDWIYEDTRFNLLQGSAETFLNFLCEIVHPVVRPDRDNALMLVEQFNDQLRNEGWILVEEEKIAGRPRFVARQLQLADSRSLSLAHTVAEALSAGSMKKQLERLEDSVERDPELAIGTAKELLESCCKNILIARGVAFSPSADLPQLTKSLAKELKLVPDEISDAAKGADTIRLVLRNLSSLTQYLAELRNLYGTGHGRDGKHRGLETRHARLAVGAAIAFITFVTDTHQQRGMTK